MLKTIQAYGGFSINNLDAAKQFYSEALGLEVKEEGPGLRILLPGGGSVITYVKDDHQPASFTVLNFEVADIDEAVKSLKQSGVEFEQYEDMNQDKFGIMRGLESGEGPNIAWFRDPAQNILAVLQER